MADRCKLVSVSTVEILPRLKAAVRRLSDAARLAERLQDVGGCYEPLHLCPREFNGVRYVAPIVAVQEDLGLQYQSCNCAVGREDQLNHMTRTMPVDDLV